jgi:hypothetical protein
METRKKKKHARAAHAPLDNRAAEVVNLRRLARRLEGAAEKLSVAATYWEDGAFETARDRLKRASSHALGVVRRLNTNAWHVP